MGEPNSNAPGISLQPVVAVVQIASIADAKKFYVDCCHCCWWR